MSPPCPTRWRDAALGWCLAWCLAWPGPATAQGLAGPPFKGADLALGERLMAEHRCADCHVQRVGGNGHAIYRPLGRIDRPAALLAMVERCNTSLGLQLFPEEVEAVAAVLQRDHYRFK